MKKTVFLILSAMAILFSGCTGPSYDLFKTAGTGNALLNTNPPAPLKGDENRGVCLPISTQSSLTIDVECIFEYVQRESTFGSENERPVYTKPWIGLNLVF
ncbi:MAG: hypothetical protein QNK25_09695 [Desulfobacterales bacterium]|nr:hypothetical protein [Desulfobacterales bacterium]